jgi:hypothetical protein
MQCLNICDLMNSLYKYFLILICIIMINNFLKLHANPLWSMMLVASYLLFLMTTAYRFAKKIEKKFTTQKKIYEEKMNKNNKYDYIKYIIESAGYFLTFFTYSIMFIRTIHCNFTIFFLTLVNCVDIFSLFFKGHKFPPIFINCLFLFSSYVANYNRVEDRIFYIIVQNTLAYNLGINIIKAVQYFIKKNKMYLKMIYSKMYEFLNLTLTLGLIISWIIIHLYIENRSLSIDLSGILFIIPLLLNLFN